MKQAKTEVGTHFLYFHYFFPVLAPVFFLAGSADDQSLWAGLLWRQDFAELVQSSTEQSLWPISPSAPACHVPDPQLTGCGAVWPKQSFRTGQNLWNVLEKSDKVHICTQSSWWVWIWQPSFPSVSNACVLGNTSVGWCVAGTDYFEMDSKILLMVLNYAFDVAAVDWNSKRGDHYHHFIRVSRGNCLFCLNTINDSKQLALSTMWALVKISTQ